MVAGKLKSLVKQFTAPPNPWRPDHQPYPILATFEPVGLKGVSGLLAVWHLGVRPQWLKVAAVADLASGILSAAKAPAIVSYAPNGGVYVAWAPLPKTAPLAGHAAHLTQVLSPLLQATPLETELTVVSEAQPVEISLPPGTG